jgi:membrane protease YdiL (CAAX protease family)
MANALFAATHTHISPWFSLMAFVTGLMWGWLYARQRSLLGVFVSHTLVGIWAVKVLGLGLLSRAL